LLLNHTEEETIPGDVNKNVTRETGNVKGVLCVPCDSVAKWSTSTIEGYRLYPQSARNRSRAFFTCFSSNGRVYYE